MAVTGKERNDAPKRFPREDLLERFNLLVREGRSLDKETWRLCGQLWNAQPLLPTDVAERLGMPAGSKYSQAARKVRQQTVWSDRVPSDRPSFEQKPSQSPASLAEPPVGTRLTTLRERQGGVRRGAKGMVVAWHGDTFRVAWSTPDGLAHEDFRELDDSVARSR